MENKRGTWGSNFGFLMAAVGSAVGLGNIWGFPYKMGSNGGFAFLLVYLLLAAFVGVAVMLGELVMGRKTGQSTVGAYRQLSKKFVFVGYFGTLCGFLILSFYSVLGGMVLRYAVGYLIALFGGDGWAGQGTSFFGWLLYDSGSMLLFYALFSIITLVIVMGGVKGGIEKFATVAMPALAALLLIIIVYIAFQPGSGNGYKFMFAPNFEPLKNNFFGVLKTAAGQMFFSLSLGMGVMATYGSYLDKKENLQKNAVIIPVFDTLIAIMAGMAVMPACAAFGVDYGAGPGLLFASMQTVFANMGGFIGNLMGFLFYFLVLIAAVTSSISLLEGTVAVLNDRNIEKGKDPGRVKNSIIIAVLIFIFGIPVALDALGSGGAAVPAPYELLGFTVEDLGAGLVPVAIDCWLDLYDCLSEGIFMPLGAMIMSILIGWVWGTKMVKEEVEAGGHTYKAAKFFEICFKFVAPIGLLIVLIAQIQSFF